MDQILLFHRAQAIRLSRLTRDSHWHAHIGSKALSLRTKSKAVAIVRAKARIDQRPGHRPIHAGALTLIYSLSASAGASPATLRKNSAQFLSCLRDAGLPGWNTLLSDVREEDVQRCITTRGGGWTSALDQAGAVFNPAQRLLYRTLHLDIGDYLGHGLRPKDLNPPATQDCATDPTPTA
jgi:hypothetical protein